MRTPKLAAALALAAGLLGLAAPVAAPAAVSCDYSSSGKLLTVALGAAGDNAQLKVVSGEIKVAQGINPVACSGPGGPPSVTNTGAISVTGNGDNFQNVTISGADDFVPGPDPQDGSDDGGGTKEIEIFVNLNNGVLSTLQVATGDDPGRLVFGTGGINANAVGELVRDADIFANNVEIIAGVGGAGPDELNARGGQGTGGVLTGDILFSGHGGIDQIEGGEGADSLFGGPGNDTLFGGGGNDRLHPDAGNDIANGALGEDTVVVAPLGVSATIDLALAGAQDTGDGSDLLVGFENATTGTGIGSTLRGDDGPNVLTGGEGNDTLEGRGGVDVLNADLGADTLLVRDGAPDTANCGPEVDTVTADPLGIDLLTDCESVIFPAPPGPATGGVGGSGQASGAAFGTRTLVSLALAGRRIPARGPLAVRVTNANAFEVSGALSGQTRRRLSAAQRKRRVKLGARSFTVPANARRTVELRLPKALRRELGRRRKLSLRLSASVRDPAGNTRTVRKTLKPRLRRRP